MAETFVMPEGKVPAKVARAKTLAARGAIMAVIVGMKVVQVDMQGIGISEVFGVCWKVALCTFAWLVWQEVQVLVELALQVHYEIHKIGWSLTANKGNVIYLLIGMLRKLTFAEHRLEGGQMSDTDTKRHIAQCFADIETKDEVEESLAYQRSRFKEVKKETRRFDQMALEVLEEEIKSWSDYSSKIEEEVADLSEEDRAGRAEYKVQVQNYIEVLKVIRTDLQEKEWKMEKEALAKK